MRYRSTFRIEAPPETVFDFLADGANALPEHPRGTTIRQDPAGLVAIGTKFTFDRPDGLRYTSVVSRFDRPSVLAFDSWFGDRTPTVGSWEFRPDRSGTLATVETRSSLVGPSWLRPFAAVLAVAAWPLLLAKMWLLKRRLAGRIQALAPDSSA